MAPTDLGTVAKLPQPATQSDMYAHAMVVELRRINDNLGKLVTIIDEVTQTPDVMDEEIFQDDQAKEIELKEPEKPKTRDAMKAAKAADTDAPVTVETVEIVPPVSTKKGTKDADPTE